MNKYKRDNLVVVIVLTLIFVVSATLVYFIYFNKPNEDKKDSIYVKVEDQKTIEEIEKIIDDRELYLLSKYEKSVDDINSLNNSEKLELANSAIIRNADFYTNGVGSSFIDEYFKNNFTSTIYWNKEDVKCSICKDNIFNYNSDEDKFYIDKEHSNKHIIFPFYLKVLDIKHKNNNYVVKVSFVWSKLESWNGAMDFLKFTDTAYASYMDAYNDNELFKIEVRKEEELSEEPNYFAKIELENNYDKYKDKLHTSIYTFEKENDNYKLVSFKYEK